MISSSPASTSRENPLRPLPRSAMSSLQVSSSPSQSPSRQNFSRYGGILGCQCPNTVPTLSLPLVGNTTASRRASAPARTGGLGHSELPGRSRNKIRGMTANINIISSQKSLM